VVPNDPGVGPDHPASRGGLLVSGATYPDRLGRGPDRPGRGPDRPG
jgi:hypothetical protein